MASRWVRSRSDAPGAGTARWASSGAAGKVRSRSSVPHPHSRTSGPRRIFAHAGRGRFPPPYGVRGVCSHPQLSEATVQASEYDAIVVGSGISGGWAAKELTEKGLRVLLLERGRNVEQVKDYPNAIKGPWEYPHRGSRTRAMEELYPVLKRIYPLNKKNLAFWANDKESPY